MNRKEYVAWWNRSFETFVQNCLLSDIANGLFDLSVFRIDPQMRIDFDENAKTETE